MTQSTASARFPYLPVHVQIGSPRHIEQELDIEALVDTGFDGAVTISPGTIDPTIVPDMQFNLALADGTELFAPAYLATVRVGTLDAVLTMVIALGEEPLLGRDVIDRYRVVFDHGTRILVEP